MNSESHPPIPPAADAHCDRQAPRRRFLKLFFASTVLGVAAGRVMRSPVLWAAEPTIPQAPGIIRINPDDYPALAAVSGSIRVSLNPLFVGGGEPYPQGVFYPVMINRLPDDPQAVPVKQFIALDTECLHAGCVVDEFSGDRIFCRCHGSEYNITGQVTNGPATEPLRVLKHTFDGVNQMTIEVPKLGYHAVPELTGGSRLKLSFFAYPVVTYRVLARAGFGPGTDWAPVGFSETPDGPVTQTQFVGANAAATLYVAASGPQAYFAITADLLQV